ncbi:MAG: hypothetical protein QOE91_1304 [Gaiellaceae bacterium]|jgi:hypothetical protein|nr:hypothetical protein [Gaiellaceae bacterium]
MLVLVALLAGCGGSGRANQVMSDAAGNLGKLRSGNLTLRLVVAPREGTRGRIGFELRGPFALQPGGLPVAKIVYTQIAGAHQGTATFISTGTKAYAEVNGKAYELPPSSTNALRQAAGGSGGSSSFGELRIDNWVKHPVVTDGGQVGGVPTMRVSGDLDVVAAANGLLDLLRQLGRAAPTIEGDQAKQLENAVKSSSFELWSGRADHLLRRLLLKADLGLDVPQSLRRVLGDVVGARIDFELAVSNPNKPVSVAPPTNPLPSSQLPGG